MGINTEADFSGSTPEKVAFQDRINTVLVENVVADNMFERSDLEYLIYNAPLEYADLIMNGGPEKYLKAVTEYKPFES